MATPVIASIAARKVRQNYLADLVAAVACFLLEAGWYTFFMQTWLNGIGRTMDWMKTETTYPLALQYSTAFVSAFVMAAGISWVTQRTGPQTALRGIKVGAVLWLGFELTAISTEYVFEVRPLSLLAVNAGYWLVGMVVMGAIVGAWKKR